MATLAPLKGVNYELISNEALKTALFEQAKAFTAKHGFVLFICPNSLETLSALADSVWINKTYVPVRGMTFIGIPLSYLGMGLKSVRDLLMELPVGKLPTMFMATSTGNQATILSIYRHWGEENCKIRASGGILVDEDGLSMYISRDRDVLVDWEVDTTHPERLRAYKRCGKCNSTDNLKLCSTCHGIHYCSAECQKGDWQEHKVQCPKLTQLCAPGLKWYE